MTEPIHIISLGAGVQSSTMALMAVAGEITPMPKCAIFADTGDESDEVYAWLDKLESLLPFEVVRICEGILSEHLINSHGTSIIPSWVSTDKGPKMGQKGCTNDFKVRPVRREIRRRFPDQTVRLWIGISTDEISRVKDSGLLWLVHRWPLVENNWNRNQCLDYLKRRALHVPKSSCVYCPFKSPNQWRKMQLSQSKREVGILDRVQALLNPRGEFLNGQLKPLSECDFSTEEDRGQLNMFNNECEGMCGV